MLMDKRLILCELLTNALGTSPYESDSIDLDDMGVESRMDLHAFFMAKTQIDTPTAFTVAFGYADSADLLTNFVTVASLAFGNTSSTPIPAGTVFRTPLQTRRQLGDITPDAKRHFGMVITYTGSGAADEHIIAWVGPAKDLPVSFKELS